MVTMSVRMDENLNKKIEEIAKSWGISKNAVIRICLNTELSVENIIDYDNYIDNENVKRMDAR